MRFVVEGSEDILKLCDRAQNAIDELRDVCRSMDWAGIARIEYRAPTKETDPAAATTEPEKND